MFMNENNHKNKIGLIHKNEASLSWMHEYLLVNQYVVHENQEDGKLHSYVTIWAERKKYHHEKLNHGKALMNTTAWEENIVSSDRNDAAILIHEITEEYKRNINGLNDHCRNHNSDHTYYQENCSTYNDFRKKNARTKRSSDAFKNTI